MSDAPETGTGFLVPVFGTDFWYVGHWHKNARRCKRTRDFALTRQHVRQPVNSTVVSFHNIQQRYVTTTRSQCVNLHSLRFVYSFWCYINLID